MDFPGRHWERAEASMLGWDVARLGEAMDAIVAFGSIGAIVAQHGRVIAEVGDPARKVTVRSVRKSLLSALFGIAVEQGHITLDATLADLGIDDVEPRLTAQELAATVRDLLQARSGIYHAAEAESPAMTAAKPPRGSAPPGTAWHYNNWDFNALGTIYKRATGQSVFAGFQDHIGQPIGMEDFQPTDGFYWRQGHSCHPAYHVRLTTRDMARFGHLCLNAGRWREKQVLPAGWIAESTRASSRTPRGEGYGYMWWLRGLEHAGTAPEASPDRLPFRFSAEGAYGQLILVVPSRGLVLANLAESRDRAEAGWADYRHFIHSVLRASPHSAA